MNAGMACGRIQGKPRKRGFRLNPLAPYGINEIPPGVPSKCRLRTRAYTDLEPAAFVVRYTDTSPSDKNIQRLCHLRTGPGQSFPSSLPWADCAVFCASLKDLAGV